MKKIVSLLMAVLCCLVSMSQELPQFKSSSLEGWVYNNPGVELNPTNVSGGRIALYVNSQGLVLTLISPEFSCQGIDSIAATITWRTPAFNQPEYDITRTALTMALDNADGQPVDSITCVPTLMTSEQMLSMTIAVPAGLSTARMRFVSWHADNLSCGAIKRALFTAITGTPHDDVLMGDVDGDNHVNISDVTTLINYLLTDNSNGVNIQAADLDGNGIVNISDVTELINYLLTR